MDQGSWATQTLVWSSGQKKTSNQSVSQKQQQGESQIIILPNQFFSSYLFPKKKIFKKKEPGVGFAVHGISVGQEDGCFTWSATGSVAKTYHGAAGNGLAKLHLIKIVNTLDGFHLCRLPPFWGHKYLVNLVPWNDPTGPELKPLRSNSTCQSLVCLVDHSNT